MQDSIWCYLNIVYSQMEYIIEIPSWMKVSQFIDILLQQFPSDHQGMWLYEKQSERLLEGDKTFQENEVESGDYLYFI